VGGGAKETHVVRHPSTHSCWGTQRGETRARWQPEPHHDCPVWVTVLAKWVLLSTHETDVWGDSCKEPTMSVPVAGTADADADVDDDDVEEEVEVEVDVEVEVEVEVADDATLKSMLMTWCTASHNGNLC
jgi:hypothetical protein